jgi:hypothetical protein
MDNIQDYSRDEYCGLERVYGTEMQADCDAVQELPAVITREGRLLAFSNVFQHALSPYELVDKTRKGHRKIIVLWLVNPQKRIISTANIPPQEPVVTTSESRKEARAVQIELMRERSAPEARYGSITRKYNFCEH